MPKESQNEAEQEAIRSFCEQQGVPSPASKGCKTTRTNAKAEQKERLARLKWIKKQKHPEKIPGRGTQNF